MTGKSYAHQLDAKNRMRIPAKLREELGEEYFVTVGSGNCLCVYTASQMEEMKKALSSVNPYREKEAKAARFIIYNTWQAEEDKQGRIQLVGTNNFTGPTDIKSGILAYTKNNVTFNSFDSNIFSVYLHKIVVKPISLHTS